jgi:hypothetical protein
MRHYEDPRKLWRLEWTGKHKLLIYADKVNLLSNKLIVYHKGKTITVLECDNVLGSNIKVGEMK